MFPHTHAARGCCKKKTGGVEAENQKKFFPSVFPPVRFRGGVSAPMNEYEIRVDGVDSYREVGQHLEDTGFDVVDAGDDSLYAVVEGYNAELQVDVYNDTGFVRVENHRDLNDVELDMVTALLEGKRVPADLKALADDLEEDVRERYEFFDEVSLQEDGYGLGCLPGQ